MPSGWDKSHEVIENLRRDMERLMGTICTDTAAYRCIRILQLYSTEQPTAAQVPEETRHIACRPTSYGLHRSWAGRSGRRRIQRGYRLGGTQHDRIHPVG